MSSVTRVQREKVHHPRRHAAVRTDDYVFSQLIPYIGNKRRLLHLIAEAVDLTGCDGGTFVDLLTGSTVVARWAKQRGFAVVANDWEPYAREIAHGTVALNTVPAFEALGGAARVFETLNGLAGCDGYVAKHLCPADDDRADPMRERMFFTRANGCRIDAIREQLAAWEKSGAITPDERAYVLAALIYAASYASNTSGVFKGYHHGWGGRTGTALYRILAPLTLMPPVLLDNGQDSRALAQDAQQLAGKLSAVAGVTPDIVYIDPPYNQHPYGSNYHVLNTIVLWDKPPLERSVMVDGKSRNKAAIRTDWRTERRSRYNYRREAPAAFAELIAAVDAKWLLVSYSTDGNIPPADLLAPLAARGRVHVFTETYKRYRVSTPRMSPQSHNVEFVAAVNTTARATPAGQVDKIIEELTRQEHDARNGTQS